MRLRSWLSKCSSSFRLSTSDEPTTAPSQTPSPKHLVSNTCTSSSSSSSSTSSLQTDLSLQTHPSLPSLQTPLSPQTLNFSTTTLSLSSLKPCSTPITSLSLHYHVLYVASGHQIHAFNTEDNTILYTFNHKHPSSGSVKSITFSKDKIFTSHQDSKIKVWKLTQKNQYKLIATLPTLQDILHRFILPKNYVKIRRRQKKLWIQHHDTVSSLAVCENLLYSVSWDKHLKLWRTDDFACMESIKAHDDAINAVVVSGDGTIYTGSADKLIKVWTKPLGGKKHAMITTLEKHKSGVNALALNSNGSVLFSGSSDSSVLVWEREDSANYMVCVGALRGHDKALLCLVYQCEFLFSGSADRTVRVWRRGGDGGYCCLTVLDGHLTPVKSVVAVGDHGGGGVKVFSGSFDGEIKVWDIVASSLNSSPSTKLNL